jgi:PleD family two-component response regulator
MVVVCPGCRTRLKISQSKHSLNAWIFKCPQCCIIFVFKKSLTQTEKGINQGKILIAHSDQAVMDKITSLLDKNGYQVVTSSDGITAILKVIKESPFLVVIERNLPKINGFEVYKRVKTKTKMKETKFIFVCPKHEGIRGDPTSSCDATLFVQDNSISEVLIGKINEIQGIN